MKRRLLYGAATVLLIFCVAFVLWQGSFHGFDPENAGQVFLYSAVSSLVFVLTVVLGFILFRTGLQLYIERQSNREGSRIKTKLVVGALALSFVPVLFLVLFSYHVLHYNLLRWFTHPAVSTSLDLREVGAALKKEMEQKASAQARWLAALSQVQAIAQGEAQAGAELARLCRAGGVQEAWIVRHDGIRLPVCGEPAIAGAEVATGAAMLPDAAGMPASRLLVSAVAPVDLALKERQIRESLAEFDALATQRKQIRSFYLMLMALIALFVLFLATWLARFLAKQISVPISALLGAAREVRSGNLAYRVKVQAIDELATLVRAFNEMTQDLESSSRELERRRRFIEAILENIPTGVISLSTDGRIAKVNRAVKTIFARDVIEGTARLDDLFSREDATEVRYLMKRARRTGLAGRQFEIQRNRQTIHLSVVVSAPEDNVASGYVMVIEDSTELLRAQKAAAWQEVARRVAHEIKNPLTPISLCADRLARQIEKVSGPPEVLRILRECASVISIEVEAVRTLVDEFSQFSRFPVANPTLVDLNDLVHSALGVFEGRLDGIEIYRKLSPGLPPVELDADQFKRVIVNLVDNAAEAMQDAPLRRLYIATQALAPDTVELVISDTGRGISPEDREKLFLPYFSTKGRGTGLGLAIVSQILAEHRASIRVEDNTPMGARFIIEIAAQISGDFTLDEIAAREAVS